MGLCKTLITARNHGFRSEPLTRWILGQKPTRSELQNMADAVYQWNCRTGGRSGLKTR